MARAEGRLLSHGQDILSQRAEDWIVMLADNNCNTGNARVLYRRSNVPHHSYAGHGMQHLRKARAHPAAFAGRKDHCGPSEQVEVRHRTTHRLSTL